MFVCVFVCMFVCVFVCMFVCVFVCKVTWEGCTHCTDFAQKLLEKYPPRRIITRKRSLLPQGDSSMNRHILWILVALLGLVPAAHAQGGKVQIKKAKAALDFYMGEELVTRYLTGEDRPKPIFWPVNAPGGVPLTRSWPQEKAQPGEATDHPHQQSAWFCHGDIIPEGIELT